MRLGVKALLIVLLSSIAFLTDSRSSLSAVADPSRAQHGKRIRFDVAAFDQQDGRRNLISQTTIEGPQGTDFQINLEAKRFQMNTRFLTDLVAADTLKVRADLNTRRLYGYSERDLPLYEEDKQKQDLQLGFNEKLVLLPFGRNNNADQLEIEITPTISEQSYYPGSGKSRPLEISIQKASSDGTITVEAWKSPHRFAVEAVLLENGDEVAHGESGEVLNEELREIVLKPVDGADPQIVNNPLLLELNINRYIRSRPTDEVAFDFSVYRSESTQRKQPQPVILHAAGIHELGSASVYDLTDYYLKGSGKKYELRLRVNLAAGEEAIDRER